MMPISCQAPGQSEPLIATRQQCTAVCDRRMLPSLLSLHTRLPPKRACGEPIFSSLQLVPPHALTLACFQHLAADLAQHKAPALSTVKIIHILNLLC